MYLRNKKTLENTYIESQEIIIMFYSDEKFPLLSFRDIVPVRETLSYKLGLSIMKEPSNLRTLHK